jgi:hypothetical protein
MRPGTAINAGLAALGAIGLCSGTPVGADRGIDSVTFLQTYARFTNDDVARVARGETAAKALDTDSAELAICAVIDVAVPPAFYVSQFRDIEAFKTGEPVLQAHRFGSPPSAADFALLKIAGGDLDDLRECRAGDCALKLDVAGIERIRSLTASGLEDGARIAETYRQHLAAYAARYLAHGDSALIEYRDSSRTDRIAEELRLIVEHSPYLARETPLGAAVSTFTGVLPGGVEGFLYWSSERVGPRAVITMTHAVIGERPGGPIAIATKQIYASHYFTASLGLTLLEDRSTPSGPLTRVIYINRSRVDAFDGLLGGMKRAITKSRARKGADHTLRALKARLEEEFSRRGGAANALPPRIQGIGSGYVGASRSACHKAAARMLIWLPR